MLTWQNNSNIETGYVVERKSDNSNWTVMVRLGANITSYTDNNLTPMTYYYRVKAVYNTEESLYSNEANITVSNPSSTSSSGGGGCSMTVGTSPINLLYWLVIPVYALLREILKCSLIACFEIRNLLIYRI
jgi:hypothetical protein